MLNRIIVQGRLTADPEIRLTTKNDKVALFTVAVQRDFDREKTDFINCVSFKSRAEFLENYFHKGDLILVAGQLQIQEYTARDGTNRKAAEILAENVWFSGGKGKTSDAEVKLAEVEDDGDFPF